MADYRRSYYVEGNTVRQEDYYDLRQTHDRVSYRQRRNRDKAAYMTLPYVLILTATCILVLFMAVNYISVRSSVSVSQKNIKALETKLNTLRVANEDLAQKVDAGMDLQEIYRVATQEMGMVFPETDQLVYYQRAESEYVRQNENIPKH